MKRALAVAALAALAATAPALAQYGGSYGGSYESRRDYGDRGDYGGAWDSRVFWRGAPNDVMQRIQMLQRRIDRGDRDGSLNRREARRAQNELNNIRFEAERRRRRGGWSGRDDALVQARLDNLARNIRWMRDNSGSSRWSWNTWGGGWGDGGGRWDDRDGGRRDGRWEGRGDGRDDGRWEDRYHTDYDARRYYREGPQYNERVLSSQDEVYRGSDGRYYCKRSDGTTGLIVGGLAGGVLGNVADGGDNRVAGTLIGGALGALLGREIDRNSDPVRCR